MYKNVLENAYPAISLHDCKIKNMTYENGNFYICFPEGFFLDGESRTGKDAKTVIKNLGVEDAIFTISNPYRIVKGKLPIYITKYKSVKDLRKLFEKGYCFTILKEYYENGEILWRGVIESVKNHKIKNHGNFEFVFYGDSLDYCFNDLDEITE